MEKNMNMNVNQNLNTNVNNVPAPQQALPTKRSNKDIALWVLIVILVVGGIVANYYFATVAGAIRLAGWIVLACVLVLLFYQTIDGKKLFKFANEAKVELYKVVWPNRQETIHTTMIIAGLVIFMSIVLWGLDSVLLSAVNWLMARG